jgi:tetratricopeptide (TPR) repeat protein
MVSFSVFGQNKKIKEDSVFFEKICIIDHQINSAFSGISLEKDLTDKDVYILGLSKKKLEHYNYLLSTFPNSEYTFSALNGKAYTEFALKNYKNATDTFLKTLKYIADNKGKTEPNNGFVFGENNEQLLNQTYKTLATIEIEQKNYKEALKYLDEAQKNSYRMSCGNALFSEIAYVANLYTECYFNLKDDKKICDILIPVAALPMVNENSITVTRLYETLLKKYNKTELKKLFQESFKTLYSKEGIINNYANTIYYVKFLDRDLILYDLSFKNLSKKSTKER